MMAKISWLERRAGYSLLLLVVSGLSILPAAWCQYCNTVNGEPLIEISSTPPSNKLNIGATVNLTCTGRQPDDQMSVNTRPHRIEWFDPQDKLVNDCRAGSPPAARMNCKITVGVLTNETLGIYTCRARNGYNHCSTKKILLGLQAEVKESTVVPPATGTKAEVKESTVVPPVTGTEAETKWSTVVHPDTGAEGPSTTRKRENVEIIAITVSLSVAIMLLGGISVFLQYCRRRCVHNQAYNKENPQPSVTFNKTLQEENQPENIYDYIDSHPLSMPPQEHEEVPLSGHNPEENPLLGTLGVESPIKRPPQARPLPPIPQIDDASQKMEENSQHKVTCSRMLQSESQNPNFQTPEEGSCTLDSTGSRGSILDGQDIALDIEKKTGLTAVSQDTDKEPGLLPSRGSISETEDETKPVFNTLRVDFSAGEPPKARELLPIPDFEDAPTRPPKPTKETKGGTKCNRNSSINSQEVEEDYEIDLKRLEVQDEVLGEGEFGIVHKGRYHCKDKKVIDVAVKQLKDTAGMTSKVALLSEVQMLKKAGRHPNIVNLVGACTHGDNILLVTDLIPGGTLESLLNSKPAPGEHSKYENVKCALNDRELIKIALQIASGMQHLERKKCIHGDLAARNVFIDENKVAKLGDFGMARDISDRGIYNKTSNSKVPWRWLSLESLRYLVYTSQSDVWSFGILLWEIATFGEVPYPDIATPWALISFLSSGRRMPRPDHCSEELYALMQSCWMENPLRRPTFDDITKRIKYLLRKVRKSYVNVQHDDITVDSEIL